jgi:hypothetical protein
VTRRRRAVRTGEEFAVTSRLHAFIEFAPGIG